MARRNDIDWEQVEKLYIAGMLTIQQIADTCKVSTSQIKAKAKQHNWQRNLAAAIAERARAKVSQIDVADLIEQSSKESAEQSAETIKKAIEEASNITAGVIRRHRKAIKDTEERAASIEAILDGTLSQAAEIRDVVAATSALKALADVRKTLITLERQSYNLDDDDGSPKDDGPLEISINLVEYDGKAIG